MIDELIRILSKNIRNIFVQSAVTYENLQEIRLRVNQPLMIVYANRDCFMDEHGQISNVRDAYIVSKMDIRETMEYISSYSMYAFEEEIKNGFITIQGGHRIGVSGRVIMEKGIIKGMNCISFVNIRIAHQIIGCADHVMPFIRNNRRLLNTLIISPPRCGKTTILRDIIRQISNGDDCNDGVKVGIVDERSEIAACYMGVPQNDVGIRTDVIDCCPKSAGMIMLIRSMSPVMIAVDEIGGKEDIHSILEASNCGCKMVATIHGQDLEEIEIRPYVNKLIENKLFDRYIVLDNKRNIGNISGIYDAEKELLEFV